MCCDKRLTSLKKLNISLLTIVDTHTWVHDPDKHNNSFFLHNRQKRDARTNQ